MTQLLRVKTKWSGFSGAPGYTVLHFRDFGAGDGGGGDASAASALAAVNRVSSFFTAARTALASTVTLNIEPEVDVLEDTTGELVTSFTTPTQAPIFGNNSGNYSAATGAVINWKTGGVRNGRKIRGRSFLVPVGGSGMDAAGLLAAGARTAILNAGIALVDPAGSPDLVVYARPSGPGATDGQAALVTGVTVPNLLAVLRSRRD